MTALWNTQQVAEHLGFTVSAVRLMARNGEFPAFKIGERWRVDPERLAEWEREREGK